jgi:cytochrome c peroxidase
VQCFKLGGATKMSEVRRGEMIFNDATVCFQHWQSCASCHPDARADGLNWDLLNDGIGNPKNSRSLILSHKTPPVMSLGVRAKAEEAVRAGFKHILFTFLEESDYEMVDEYLKSLHPIPSPALVNGKLSASAVRGQKVFEEAGCTSCHNPPHYTSLRSYSLGHSTGQDAEKPFDTPTLIESWRTAPYLFDGRAVSLEEVFTRYNSKDKHGMTSKLSADEMKDLVEYVRSL